MAWEREREVHGEGQGEGGGRKEVGRTCLEEAERLLPDVAPQLVRGGGGGGGREVGRTCLEEAERLLPDVASQLIRGGWGEREGKWGVPVLRKQSAFSQTSPLSWSVGDGGRGKGSGAYLS